MQMHGWEFSSVMTFVWSWSSFSIIVVSSLVPISSEGGKKKSNYF